MSENMFPTRDQEKELYNLKENEALAGEFNSEKASRVPQLAQQVLNQINGILDSKRDVRLVPAREPSSKNVIPGRVAIIATASRDIEVVEKVEEVEKIFG